MLPDAAAVVSTALHLIACNESLAKLLCCERVDLLQRSFETVIQDSAETPALEILRSTANETPPRARRLLLRASGGDGILTEMRSAEVRLGEDLAYLATFRVVEGQELALLAMEARRHARAVATWRIGVYEHDHLSGHIYGSPRLRDLYGFAPEEVLTIASFGEAFYVEDREKMLRAIARAHDPEGTGDFDILHRIIRTDGALRWLHTRATTTFGAVGGRRVPVLTTGSVMDMTERQELAIALKCSEERLSQATRASRVGIFDQDHCLSASDASVYWSPTMKELLGMDGTECASWDWFRSRIHPTDATGVELAFRRAREPEGDGSYDVEFRWYRGDGSLRWLMIRATTFFGEARGRWVPIRTVGAMLDVTDRKSAEEDRQRSAAILDATPDFVSVTNLDGALVYLNRAAREFLGILPEASLHGQNIAVAHPPETFELIKTVGAPHALRHGSWTSETHFVTHDGRVVPMSQVLLAHHDASGGAAYLSTIARDLSREKELEEQFRQAQKMEAIGRLAGGVAHDFNNLLSVILGFSALAATKLCPGHGAMTDLDEVRRAGERAAALTRQLLAFGRKQILKIRVMDLSEAVSDMEPMLRRLVDENIQVIVRQPSATAAIKADPNQIQQIILNLVVNARDAMPDGGVLTIEVRAGEYLPADATRPELDLPSGSYAAIAVADTGHGMDSETRRRVFEPFFTTKGPGEGTGLGLSMVFGIVRQSGGGVSVESEPGQGATFTVYLPATNEPVEEAPPSRAGLRAARGGVILVAEDDVQLRSMVTATLVRAGYEVLSAADPSHALQMASTYEGKIDVLLTDVLMPKMNGKQLADELLRQHPEVAVLYMSGYTEDSIAHRGVLDEGVDFLAKPVTPGSVLVAIQALLAERERSCKTPE